MEKSGFDQVLLIATALDSDVKQSPSQSNIAQIAEAANAIFVAEKTRAWGCSISSGGRSGFTDSLEVYASKRLPIYLDHMDVSDLPGEWDRLI